MYLPPNATLPAGSLLDLIAGCKATASERSTLLMQLSDMLEASKSFAQGKFGRKRGETKQEAGGDETAAPTISISMNADI